MKEGPDLAQIAALVGDPARANMLSALLAGKALTARELAHEAGLTPSTTSSHLSKLDQGGLVTALKQGRHKYFRLKNADVAAMLESIAVVAATNRPHRTRTGPRDAAMRTARVCYNHLAGEMGVALHDQLLAGKILVPADDQSLRVTPVGHGVLTDFGIDMSALEQQRSLLAKDCLDWSERKTHLAGSLGRAILAQILARGWARRDASSRAIVFSPMGAQKFQKWLNALGDGAINA